MSGPEEEDMLEEEVPEGGGEPRGEPPMKVGPGVQYGVETRNAFEALSDNVRRKTVATDKRIIVKPLDPKQKRPPPISVLSDSTESTNNFIKQVEKVTMNFKIKNTLNGFKVVTENINSHKNIISLLKSTKFQFFTHPLGEEKQRRFVLYGLDERPTEDIEKALSDEGLHAVRVVPMTTKVPRYHNQCNYIIVFDNKSQITLSQLRETKAIHHTIVSWDHYRSKSSGISCCRNCCQFGHGAKSCGMKSKCILCADAHHFTDCKLLNQRQVNNQEKIDPKHLKCANCQDSHTATYNKCPERLQFIKNKQQFQSGKKTTKQDKSRGPPIMDTINFPATIAPVADSPRIFKTPKRVYRPTIADKVRNTITPIQYTSELYTMDQCQTIMNELYRALKSCTTKQDQAKVIFDYSLKYLTYGP